MNKLILKSSSTFLIYVILSLTLFSGLVLSSSAVSAEDNEVIDTVELTVPIACTMGGVGTNSHNASINPGTYSGASGNEYENGIGKTTLTAFCNDNNGFAIYAIGFTGDVYEGENHTKLIGQNTNETISTKVYASGDTTSNWSMKVTKVDNPVSGSPVTYNPNIMTITNSFNNWHIVPDTYTKVADYHSSTTDPSTTDTTLGAKLETTYATYISTTQPADTYSGQVKYTMVHPYNHTAPEPPTFRVLYTGRALSDTPGQENPVTMKLSELPEGSTYNLLGTADGLYDKLTPDTLYGGYFKYTGDIDEFTAKYLDNYEIYDGGNIDWMKLQVQSIDAAQITPEGGTVYIVREVPTNYLLCYIRYYYNRTSGAITSLFFMLDTDMDDYDRVGFILDNINSDVFGIYDYLIFQNTTETAATYFGAQGVEAGFVSYIQADSLLTVGNHTILPYWVTQDSYKVTAAQLRTITLTEINRSGYSASRQTVPSTITKWQE
ncbi:hypothetical protein IKF30_02450 [Candidatus Saccharibacteria bacterium]|nr:hypothetical protein [Candidatus Saccharibacteria bacterium]